MEKRRVVVTGIGLVSPYGIGYEKFWDNIKEGKSGISKIERIPLIDQKVSVGGEVKNFDEISGLDPKQLKRMDRYIQMALVAAREAAADSGIDFENLEDPYRYGVVLGSAAGGFRTFEDQHLIIIAKGPTRCAPYTVPMIISNMAAGEVSKMLQVKGLNKAVTTACATSNHCLGDAMRSIQFGDADVIVAGGSDAVITHLSLGAFTSAHTLSKCDVPEIASRPYDKDRGGFVMSEGSAVLILEELEHAKARGAKIYAEIVGYGQTADAYDLVAPDPEGRGAIKAMEFAVRDAGIEPKDIDYINAHGTSTGLGDKAESHAIAKVFGDLETNPNLKVSSTKSMHGHLLGATGATEAIACIMAMRDGIVPPTINLDNQDEEVANLNYVPHKAQKAELNYVLSNSFGFGGHNASLVFKKYQA